MKYLVSTVETYHVDTETAVENIIAEAKEDTRFQLLKYNCEKKEIKAKGEVIDEYFKLSLTKVFNDIKEPVNEINVEYEVL